MVSQFCIASQWKLRNVIVLRILSAHSNKWPVSLLSSFNFIWLACGDPGSILNGIRNGTPSYTVGSNVTYQCNVGFIRKGSGILICQNNETWDNNPPTCLTGKFSFYFLNRPEEYRNSSSIFSTFLDMTVFHMTVFHTIL